LAPIISAMKFFAALLLFVVFATLLSMGIVLLLAGKPILFIVTLGLFVAGFIKYGCLSH